MRLGPGAVNALLMVTLVKPIVRRMVRRWRRQAQESPAAALGIPVQELLEAALIEELGATTVELETEPAEAEAAPSGRSFIRTLLIGGILVAAAMGAAVSVVKLVQRRREVRRTAERELVAVPIDVAAEAVEDAMEESPVR